MMEIQSHLFNLDPAVHYLNCAYMSPQLKAVTEAGLRGMKGKERPNMITAPDFFNDGMVLREKYAKLIGADAGQVFQIPSVSYGMGIMAKNLQFKAGQEIILVGEQFPSNAYPWLRLAEEANVSVRMITAPDSILDRGAHWNSSILEAINEQTALVAMAHCHWADGTQFDLAEIRRKTREIGAALILDGTQSVGALPFDISRYDPDALFCGGYKWLLGPYSLGMGYVHPKYNNGVPMEESWINRKGSEDFAGLVDYEPEYQPGAGRYAVGEHSNFIMTPMLTASIEQILAWGPHNIQAYCKQITSEGIQKLRQAGFWIEDESYRGYHLFGIGLPDHLDPEIVRARLADNNIFVSVRGTFVRVAAHVFNSAEDIDALVTTLIDEVDR